MEFVIKAITLKYNKEVKDNKETRTDKKPLIEQLKTKQIGTIRTRVSPLVAFAKKWKQQ